MLEAPTESAVLKALCLFNPLSGNGAAAAEAATEAMHRFGVDTTLVAIDSCDPAKVLTEQATGFQRIVVCGGDGTLHGLLPSLLELRQPFGLIPAGTANDFARSLGLSDDPETACRVIAEGVSRVIDVGYLGRRPFVNAVQIGMAASVAQFHDGWHKKWLGVLGYPVSWIKAWRATRPFRADLDVNGARRRVRVQQITIGNGRSYGGGMVVAEEATIDEGLLHLVYVGPLPMAEWVRLFPRLRRGERAPEIVHLAARHVAVWTRRPQPLSVDGEPAGTTPAVITVKPRRLAVYAPPEGDSP